MDTIAVYSALFGNYDELLPAAFPDVEHILFTDRDVQVAGWSIRRVKPPHLDSRYASRYYFDQSCLVMPKYTYTIMHGANAQLLVHPGELVNRYLKDNFDLACYPHPATRNAYHEAELLVMAKKDYEAVINAQMARYRAKNFPDTVRQSACFILIRRRSARLQKFEAAWWAEVRRGSCRDQLSFDYVRWKLNFPVHHIPGPCGVTHSKVRPEHILKIYPHRTEGQR